MTPKILGSNPNLAHRPIKNLTISLVLFLNNTVQLRMLPVNSTVPMWCDSVQFLGTGPYHLTLHVTWAPAPCNQCFVLTKLRRNLAITEKSY
jgi:hypothetical protein